MSLHLVVTRCSLGAYCNSSHFPDYFILLRGIFGTALGHQELIAKVTPCWLGPLPPSAASAGSIHYTSVSPLEDAWLWMPGPCSLLGARDSKVDGWQAAL